MGDERVGALALYLSPTAKQPASSSPTDSPFRMSHHRASKDKHISPEGPTTCRAGQQNNLPARLQLKVWRISRDQVTGTNATIGAQRGEIEFRSDSQMWSQDVPRDWACNPSPPPFSPPLSLSWLMITYQQTAKPLTTTQHHPLLRPSRYFQE